METITLDNEMLAFLNEYETFVDNNSTCKEPELYGLKHLKLLAAAKNGNMNSLRAIAITVLKGDGVPTHFDNAREIMFRLMSEKSDDLISKYYYYKCLCLEGNHSKGLAGMSKLIESNFAPALAFKGNLYHFGLCDTDVDFLSAKEKYEKAVQMHHVPSAFLLSKLLLKEGGVTRKFKALSSYLTALRLTTKGLKDIAINEQYVF